MYKASLIELEKRLRARFEHISIKRDAPMARYTTLHLGGPADMLVSPEKPEQIQQVLLHAHELQVPVIIIGEMGLNSVWTYMLYSKTFWAKLPLRLLTNVIECPIKVALLMGMSKLLERFPKSYLKL